jgi:Fe2+ transport system protein FeoA
MDGMDTVMCGLCGRAVAAPETRQACAGCGLAGGCRRWKCPHCGYENPAEPALLRWWRRVRRRLGLGAAAAGPLPAAGAGDCGPLTLADGVENREGIIVGLHTAVAADLRRLTALGLVPGTHLRLLRRRPAFVFQIGNSRFAVDRHLAKAIQMQWHHPAPPAVPSSVPLHPPSHKS